MGKNDWRDNILAAMNGWVSYSSNCTALGPRLQGLKFQTLEYPKDEPLIKEWFEEIEKDGRKLSPSSACGIKEADDGEYILVMERVKDLTIEDYDWYTEWCGCDDIAAAESMYGPMVPEKVHIGIKFHPHLGGEIVSFFAKYCWS